MDHSRRKPNRRDLDGAYPEQAARILSGDQSVNHMEDVMRAQTTATADSGYYAALEGGARSRSARGVAVPASLPRRAQARRTLAIRLLRRCGAGIPALALGGVLALVALAGSARAQSTNGTVNFCNNSSNLLVFLPDSTPVTASNNIKAALYWAPVGSNRFVMLGAASTVGVPRLGIFAGGTRVAGPRPGGGGGGPMPIMNKALPMAGIALGFLPSSPCQRAIRQTRRPHRPLHWWLAGSKVLRWGNPR